MAEEKTPESGKGIEEFYYKLIPTIAQELADATGCETRKPSYVRRGFIDNLLQRAFPGQESNLLALNPSIDHLPLDGRVDSLTVTYQGNSPEMVESIQMKKVAVPQDPFVSIYHIVITGSSQAVQALSKRLKDVVLEGEVHKTAPPPINGGLLVYGPKK